jgi:hypothetical protein
MDRRAGPVFAIMLLNKHHLASGKSNFYNSYVIEFNGFGFCPDERGIKAGDTPPMQVSPIMLLKTHIEKMSVLGFAIMCMKIKDLKVFTFMLMIIMAVRQVRRIFGSLALKADTSI